MALFKKCRSKIAGTGNCACQDIPAGTNLGAGITRVARTGDPDRDYRRTPVGKYTNHSADPNVRYRKQGDSYEFVAKKKIRRGEELTIDYHKFDFEGKRDF